MLPGPQDCVGVFTMATSFSPCGFPHVFSALSLAPHFPSSPTWSTCHSTNSPSSLGPLRLRSCFLHLVFSSDSLRRNLLKCSITCQCLTQQNLLPFPLCTIVFLYVLHTRYILSVWFDRNITWAKLNFPVATSTKVKKCKIYFNSVF